MPIFEYFNPFINKTWFNCLCFVCFVLFLVRSLDAWLWTKEAVWRTECCFFLSSFLSTNICALPMTDTISLLMFSGCNAKEKHNWFQTHSSVSIEILLEAEKPEKNPTYFPPICLCFHPPYTWVQLDSLLMIDQKHLLFWSKYQLL